MTDRDDFLSHISYELKAIREAQKNSEQEAVRQSALIANIQVDLLETIADIRAVARLVKDGNGRPSLMERCFLLERLVQDHQIQIKELDEAMQSRSNEDLRGKWSLAGIIAAAIFSLIATVMTVISKR